MTAAVVIAGVLAVLSFAAVIDLGERKKAGGTWRIGMIPPGYDYP